VSTWLLATLGPVVLVLVLVVGIVAGLFFGVYFARQDLRAADADIRTLRSLVWSCPICTPRATSAGLVPPAPISAEDLAATPSHPGGRYIQ